MRELSTDEKFLVDYVPHCTTFYKLAKYYETDDDERYEIPDIWDTLNDALDKADEAYDKDRLDYARGVSKMACRNHVVVERKARVVADYNSLLDKVSASTAEYFVYAVGHTRAVFPVIKEERPVYKLVMIDHKLSFEKTEDTVEVWVFEGWQGDHFPYDTVSKSGQAVMVDQVELKLGGLYAFAQLDPKTVTTSIENRNYFVCSDCGKYFYLTDGEISFYKKKELFLPKRCDKCRVEKKARQAKQRSGNDILKGV